MSTPPSARGDLSAPFFTPHEREEFYGTFSVNRSHADHGQPRAAPASETELQDAALLPFDDKKSVRQLSDLPDITFSEGTYVGESIGDIPHGKGVFTFANGDVYDGEWRNGQKHGHGVYKQGNTTFEGEFVNDKRNGPGVLTGPNQNKCVGDWVNDQRHGTMIFTTGGKNTRFEYWENGAKKDPVYCCCCCLKV